LDHLIFQLAGTNRPIALAQANAILSRIDLLCEVIAQTILSSSLKVFFSSFVSACYHWASAFVVVNYYGQQ
jgi:hypothetical protein